MKKIHKFVITGGPCGGKTTALERLKTFFTNAGYKVFTIPEAASEFVRIGASYQEISVNDTQDFVIKMMLFYEERTEILAQLCKKDVIIFCDRGVMDHKAYMPYEDFINLLQQNGLTERDALARYDAVFHLITAANGAEEYYTLENNQARHESLEEARALDERTIDSWKEHDNQRIIDNSTPFEEKISKLISEIKLFL